MSFNDLLPAILGGMAAAMVAGAVYGRWAFRIHPLVGSVAGLHLWLALVVLLTWSEPEVWPDWRWKAAYAGLLVSPLAGAGIAGLTLRAPLAIGAGAASALYQSVMLVAFLLGTQGPVFGGVILAGALAGAAWLGWLGVKPSGRGGSFLLLASLLALPALPLAFVFFSFLGFAGIAPSAVFLAAARQSLPARTTQDAS